MRREHSFKDSFHQAHFSPIHTSLEVACISFGVVSLWSGVDALPKFMIKAARNSGQIILFLLHNHEGRASGTVAYRLAQTRPSIRMWASSVTLARASGGQVLSLAQEVTSSPPVYPVFLAHLDGASPLSTCEFVFGFFPFHFSFFDIHGGRQVSRSYPPPVKR